MKLRKRLAAVLLSAVMILTGLTACDGTAPAGPAELTWQNSRTKKYLDTKGITAQEYTLTADMMASGQKVELKYAIKGKRAGYETAADSQSAESYAHSIRACWGYFTLPTDQYVGSISAGKYKKDDKTYDTETLKVYQENVYATYTYCYDGNELSFILVEPIVGMENIDLKPTADEAVIAIPPVDRVMKD